MSNMYCLASDATSNILRGARCKLGTFYVRVEYIRIFARATLFDCSCLSAHDFFLT